MMKARLNPQAAAPAAMKAMYELEGKIADLGLDPTLVELVKTRASQINRCAYCINMHTRDARALGETEARLYLLDAWRESPLYSDRERAALAWTEALTDLAHSGAGDGDYALLQSQFSPEEQVNLTLLIATINAWNRFGVGFRLVHPKEARM
jgi:AhpD family alkylhydroperoxidase